MLIKSEITGPAFTFIGEGVKSSAGFNRMPHTDSEAPVLALLWLYG